MGLRIKEVKVTLLEAVKTSPFLSRWNTYIYRILELDGEALVRFGQSIYRIVGLEWDESGMSQRLVADCGMRFRLADVEEVKDEG